MSMWLTNQQLQYLQRAYQKGVESPVPTQVISSGECFPPPQTQQQAQVESLIQEEAEMYAGRQGIPRQTYLRSSSGMAAAFLAMNQVHGEVYNVDTDEAEDPEAAGAQKDRTKNQFIFDVHTHHVHDDYSWEGQLWIRDAARGNNQSRMPWNPELVEQELDLKFTSSTTT